MAGSHIVPMNYMTWFNIILSVFSIKPGDWCVFVAQTRPLTVPARESNGVDKKQEIWFSDK